MYSICPLTARSRAPSSTTTLLGGAPRSPPPTLALLASLVPVVPAPQPQPPAPDEQSL